MSKSKKNGSKAPKASFKFSKYDAPVGVDEGFEGNDYDSVPKYEEMAFVNNGGSMKQAYAGA